MRAYSSHSVAPNVAYASQDLQSNSYKKQFVNLLDPSLPSLRTYRVPKVEKTSRFSDLIKLENYTLLVITKLYNFFKIFNQPAF